MRGRRPQEYRASHVAPCPGPAYGRAMADGVPENRERYAVVELTTSQFQALCAEAVDCPQVEQRIGPNRYACIVRVYPHDTLILT